VSGGQEPGSELDPGSLDDPHWRHGRQCPGARLLAFFLTTPHAAAGSLQELRSLMHTRKQVSREETRHVQRNESASKRKPVRLRHGSPLPKTMLVQRAWAAKRKKDRYDRAQFRSSAGR
jgi:hypothetical protein